MQRARPEVEISITLSLRLGGFGQPYLKPLFDFDQLRDCFFYVLKQLVHHGVLHLDPLGEGTNIPDLLGARELGRHTREKMLVHLPRVQPAALLKCLKLSLPREMDLPLELVGEAAAAAVGLAAPLGKSRIVRAARRAAMEIAGGKQQLKTLAAALGSSCAALKRLRSTPADQRLVEAVRRQLRMRAALAARLQAEAALASQTARCAAG